MLLIHDPIIINIVNVFLSFFLLISIKVFKFHPRINSRERKDAEKKKEERNNHYSLDIIFDRVFHVYFDFLPTLPLSIFLSIILSLLLPLSM